MRKAELFFLRVVRWLGLYATPRVVVLIHGGGWIGGTPSDWEPLPSMLRAAGLKVINLDYPVWPNATVAEQERWVEERIRGAMAENPLSKVALLGGSAGGHLALRNSHLPDHIVALNPALNTCEIGEPFVEAMNGQCERHRPGTPACPVRIWHGTDDTTVPISYSRDYARHEGVELTEVPGAEHGFFNRDGNALYQEVVRSLESPQ